MRRLLAGLLAVLAAVMVGGPVTVLALLVFGYTLMMPAMLASAGTPWEIPALVACLLVLVSLLVAGADLGARTGEMVLLRRGVPLLGTNGVLRPFWKRVMVGIAAYAAGVAVGLGWVLSSVMLGMEGQEEELQFPRTIAFFLAAAGPTLGVAATRLVERWASRNRGGETGGSTEPVGSPGPAGAAAAGEGVPLSPPQAPVSSFGGCFTSSSAATASTAARIAPST